MLSLVRQLATVQIPAHMVAFRDGSALGSHLKRCPDIAVKEIGCSRAGQPLFGYSLGDGPHRVTITAGCHADEPVGPMTAQALADLLAAHAPDLLESCHFRVVPQMNPDGADRNRAWFADPPDFETYLAHAVRELPGDDVEFGFAELPEARPECRAALRYLWADGPVAAHFSLHGMAWAEGAWFLINEGWGDRAGPLMDDLSAHCRAQGLPQMEIDRKGEKGFRRLGKGISTTPTSTAMKAHFLALDDPDMAARFLPSSMEAAASAGGDPLCMVSELPLFLLDVPPSLADPVLYRFQQARDAALAAGSPGAIRDLAREFRLRPLPLAQQVAVQFAMIVLAVRHRLAQLERPSR